MLYLIGGAARAGKSNVARRILAEMGVPYFCLDYLMMGLSNGLPASGVDADDPDEVRVADRMWPVVKPLVTAMLENGENYLIEGVQVRPVHAWELSQTWPGQVRSCFLGYADADVARKVNELRRFDPGHNDWMSDFDDAEMARSVKAFIALSGQVRDECARYGLRYIETSLDFSGAVADAVDFLKAGS